MPAMHSNFTKTNQKNFSNRGRAPFALVLDPPLNHIKVGPYSEFLWLMLCFFKSRLQSVFTLYMFKVLIKNIFGHGIKLHTVLLYIVSIFTIQDFTSSKTD